VTVLRAYPYLFANLGVFAVLLAYLIRARRSAAARLAAASGLVCLPCSLLAFLHEGSYWRPARVGGGAFGVEDPMFSFTMGALVWLAASRLSQSPPPLPVRAAARRFLIWGLPAIPVLLCLWLAGTDPMTATVAAGAALLAALLIRRPRMWKLAAGGVCRFLPAYVLLVRIQFAVWPDYALAWNPESAWSYPIVGMPVGEIAWAIVFAAMWPVLVASAFSVSLDCLKPAAKLAPHQRLP
jgi:hypothetical protein